MEVNFINKNVNLSEFEFEKSNLINQHLLNNNKEVILKIFEFLNSSDKILQVHGFIGTGKRQIINYVSSFVNKDIIKLEFYCRQASVCDDILLNFNEEINKLPLASAINLNAKISTLNTKFLNYISSIKKNFLIVIHSLDNITSDNIPLILNLIKDVSKLENIKLIFSSRSMLIPNLSDININKKISVKALTIDNCKNFLAEQDIKLTDRALEDFYKISRGYYFYIALSIKLIQALNINLAEFLLKIKNSGLDFDKFLGKCYIELIPNPIKNLFYFLKTIRHGINSNTLAVLDLYDDFSLEYLETNHIIFQSNNTFYVQDYFHLYVETDIPVNVEIKLHDFIIKTYQNMLKEAITKRYVLMSKQCLKSEIDYHSKQIEFLEENKNSIKQDNHNLVVNTGVNIKETPIESSKNNQKDIKVYDKTDTKEGFSPSYENLKSLVKNKQYTDAIETYYKNFQQENCPENLLIEAKLLLAKAYFNIKEFHNAENYFKIAERYYAKNKELINLNYLYYDLALLYIEVYRYERAIDYLQKIIYSVDTPQSLLVTACVLIGNVYSDMDEFEKSYNYYQQALNSLDKDTNSDILAELYFKLGLANDDNENEEEALKYYFECINIQENNEYLALAYSNIASCYYDKNDLTNAFDYFEKGYIIEKDKNNFDGIYYNAKHLAEICLKTDDKPKALNYLIEAKSSAEFINETYYILESTIALGDFYYLTPKTHKKALIEYFKAKNLLVQLNSVDDKQIINRINDMKLRMSKEDFEEIEMKYE